MPDEIDQAQQQEERLLAEALEAQRKNAVLMPYKGCCYFCEESFEGDKEAEKSERKFCDADCRDMWEKEQKAAKIRGGR